MPRPIVVAFAVPREVAFDFLVDPRHRTTWQSSLRTVGEARPMPPQVGTRWRERAVGGVVSDMRLTVVDRPTAWAESGTSRGISMDLALAFDEEASGCRVTARVHFAGTGWWRLVAPVATLVFPHAIRHDLARAARLVAEA